MSDPSAPSVDEGARPAPPDPDLLIAGRLRLDARDERIWLDDRQLRLGGKAFLLLKRLMRSPQALVTKDELFESAWPGLAVSESVLTTAVKEIRQALGDDARRPTFIETVHGRGYRFLPRPGGEAEQPPPPADAAPSANPRARRGFAVAAGIVGLALLLGAAWLFVDRAGWMAGPHPKSVAVRPFDDLSPGRRDQWFADGLTEEVLSTLARTADLRVAARLPAGQDLGEAARSRRVGHILAGTVRRSGDRVRVTADLIRSSDGVHVWSQSYDRKGGDIISIQEDLGVQIARALRTATDPAKLRAMAASGTRSVEAYEAYLRGLALDRRQLEEGDVAYARQADAAFEEARRLDPAFAAAHWRAAQTWFGRTTRVDSPAPDDGVPEAERLARYFERVDAAIASSADETQSLKYESARAFMQLRFRHARDLMERYLDRRPRDIDAWEEMAALAAYVGDRRATARAARRVHALALEAGEPRSRAISLMVHALRYDEAAEIAARVLRDRPKAAVALYQAHRAALYAGRREEARDYLERLTASALPEHDKQVAALRQACADRRLADARRLYARLSKSPRLTTRFHAAQVMGDDAVAVRALAPLDTPDRLPTLMQFMIYPSFDAGAYPVLRAKLAADGLTPQRPVAVPHRCG